LIARPHSTTLINMYKILIVDNRNKLKRIRELTRLRVKKFRDYQQRDSQRREVTLSNLNASYQTW